MEQLRKEAAQRTDWAVGYQDEVWWSRLTHPNLHAWVEADPLRLVEQSPDKHDADPKAFACYGIDLRWRQQEEVWLRFVAGNPKSEPTIQFLAWVLTKTYQADIRVLLMFWDHASWHKSKVVRQWIRRRNLKVKQSGKGTRLLVFLLPKKSPWLNPIEPRWIHAKRKVVEPNRTLSMQTLAARVCAVFQQPLLPWLNNSNHLH